MRSPAAKIYGTRRRKIQIIRFSVPCSSPDIGHPTLTPPPLPQRIERGNEVHTRGKTMGCTSSKEKVAGGATEPATAVSAGSTAVDAVKPTVSFFSFFFGRLWILIGLSSERSPQNGSVFFVFGFAPSGGGFPAPAQAFPCLVDRDYV